MNSTKLATVILNISLTMGGVYLLQDQFGWKAALGFYCLALFVKP